MAQRSSPGPPTTEALDNMWLVLGSTDEPVTAAQLTKKLQPPHKIRERELQSILDMAVEEGRLFTFPGKTAKAKPRFWDRDARAITCQAALEAAREAERPLTARELVRLAKGPIKLPEDELAAFLDAQVADGQLHAIPRATAKSKGRYWNRDVIEYGRLAIGDSLRAKGPQSEATLKKAAKGANPAQAQQSLEKAIESGLAWRHPPLGKSRTVKFGAAPPSPEKYLDDLGKQLGDLAGALKLAGVSREAFRRAVVQMVESAGVSLAGGAKPAPPEDQPAAAPTYDLIALMKRVEPGAERGALVTSRDLRRAAHLEKQDFDRAVMELARQGRLSLHRHDFVPSLSEQERDELVSDGNGTYYVGMAIRQNTK